MTYFQVWRRWCRANPDVSYIRKALVYTGLAKSYTFEVLKNVYHIR